MSLGLIAFILVIAGLALFVTSGGLNSLSVTGPLIAVLLGLAGVLSVLELVFGSPGSSRMARWSLGLGLLSAILTVIAIRGDVSDKNPEPWEILPWLFIYGLAAIFGGVSVVLGVSAVRRGQSRPASAVGIVGGLLPFVLLFIFWVQKVQSERSADRKACEELLAEFGSRLPENIAADCRKVLGR